MNQPNELVYEEYDLTEEVGDYYFNKDKKFMSNFFKLNWKDVLGAVISAALVSMLGYFLEHYNTFAFLANYPLLTVGALAGAASLLKALLTTSEGKFAGAIPVK